MLRFLLSLVLLVILIGIIIQHEKTKIKPYYGVEDDWQQYSPNGLYFDVNFPEELNFKNPPLEIFLCLSYSFMSQIALLFNILF